MTVHLNNVTPSSLHPVVEHCGRPDVFADGVVVNMPVMLYGEWRKAFRRLQLEIISEFSEHSISAWNRRQAVSWQGT